jgi:WG containing repeat
MKKLFFYFCCFAVMCITACNSSEQHKLYRFTDSKSGLDGYKDKSGKVIIPAGKYLMCFTDTFRAYAFVEKEKSGLIAIDQSEHELYHVFVFDNGPDYPAEGLFRIVKDDLIGYADEKSGKVIIEPKYHCAWPFTKGIAMVSDSCQDHSDGEYHTWTSNHWYYINKNGNRCNAPKL